MPQLHVFKSNAELPPHFECQIRSFIRVHWFDVYAHDINAPVTPEHWHPAHVVLAEEHVLLGAACVLWQDLEHEGVIYKTYGLGTVFTYPAFRGKGYGHLVVSGATQYIRQTGDADIAILFTRPVLEGFYAQCGWEYVPNMTLLTGSKNQPEVYETFSMMMFLSERGKKGQNAIENGRLYFGEHSW